MATPLQPPPRKGGRTQKNEKKKHLPSLTPCWPRPVGPPPARPLPCIFLLCPERKNSHSITPVITSQHGQCTSPNENLSFRIHALQIPPLGFYARRGKRHKRFFVGDFLFAESDCPGRFPVPESDCPSRFRQEAQKIFCGGFFVCKIRLSEPVPPVN